MNLNDAPQGSDGWLLARCGRATASEFSSVQAKGEGKTRSKYLRRVVAERLTGKPLEGGFSNAHTDRGHQQEPFGKLAYEARTGNIIEEAGFIQHPTLMAGCSPDGLVDADGGVEGKSVIATVQLETILGGSYPPEHKAQIQGSLWITGRTWWDFISYCPDLPPHLQLYVFRVKRDDAYIKTLATEVIKFLAEVDELYESLMKRAA